MKLKKQIGFILSPIGILILLGFLWIHLIKPKTLEFLKNQFPKINELQNVVIIKIEDLDISILKLQIGFSKVNIDFKENSKLLHPLNIQNLRLQIDPFKLLVGQFSISKVYLIHAEWSLLIPKDNKQKSFDLEELPIQDFFKISSQIPLFQVFLINSSIKIKDENLDLGLQINLNQVNLFNQKNKLDLVVKNLNLQSLDSKFNHIKSDFQFEANLQMIDSKSEFLVHQLQMSFLDSHLNANLKINDLQQFIKKPNGHLEFNNFIHLDDLRTIGLSLFPQKSRFPSLTGSIKTNGKLEFDILNSLNGQIQLDSENVNLDHFKLGQARVKAEIKKNQIFINQISLEHPSGEAVLNNIEIEQKSPYHFKSKVNLKNFDLQKLFVSMGMKNIPAGLEANSQSVCEGNVQPELNIDCLVQAELADIWIKPNIQENLHILKLKKSHIDGKVHFTNSQLNYETRIEIGSSMGSSKGEVIFNKGFNIDFKTEKLSFADVESLADLNFKGDLNISGNTTGDSQQGIINSHFIFDKGEIDGFKVGKVESELKYEKSILTLSKTSGLIGSSKYIGQIQFNFLNPNINAQLDLNPLNLEDVYFALNEKFKLPVEFNGQGNGQLELSGPFNFWKLNYKLISQFKQGSVANESFDTMQFNLTSNGDKIHFDQVNLKKANSSVVLTGHLQTQPNNQAKDQLPDYNLKVSARPFYLEDSDHLIQEFPFLTGQIWLDGQITGPLLDPQLNFNYNAKQLSYENNDYPGSQGKIILNRKNLQFSGQILGRQLQTEFLWPWDEKNPFNLKLQVRDLNPLIFLPFISLPQPSTDYYSHINADVDLKAQNRSLSQADGTIKVNNFMLQKGAHFLKLKNPSTLQFKNGLHEMNPIELNGENNKFIISLTSNHINEIKTTLKGELQLKLFQFMTPFIQSLAGKLLIDSYILFHNNDFELFGDGEITDSTILLKGFPHPIENINAPLEFSKSKIIISDLMAQLGQNEILGQGQIDIKGQHNILVNLQASAENIELNFPDQIQTNGKLDLFFIGSWLPYTLKANYLVSRGLVTKNFGSEPEIQQTVKPSNYLPPQQIEQQTPSLLLDVNVDLSSGIVVKNQILEGDAKGKLNIYGSPERPQIAGTINISQGSKLIFKDKPFDIETAQIKFPNKNESNQENLPELYINANARVSEYDINLLVQGVPTKNLSIKPTSQPPLSENDLFSLLALGLISTKMDQNLSSELQQKQTGLEIIASKVNQSELNKKFEEKFGLTVQLAPSVDSTKNIAVPKVVVSKKIKKNISASYSRPLTGENQNEEWKLQYLFNPNKSMILNYQNIESSQQDQIQNSNKNESGILGLDFEYKKEFK